MLWGFHVISFTERTIWKQTVYHLCAQYVLKISIGKLLVYIQGNLKRQRFSKEQIPGAFKDKLSLNVTLILFSTPLMLQTIVQYQFHPYYLRLRRDMFTMHSTAFCARTINLHQTIGLSFEAQYWNCLDQDYWGSPIQPWQWPCQWNGFGRFFIVKRFTYRSYPVRWFTSYLKDGLMSLLFVKVFPRDPDLAPCFLSSLSMAYRFTSLHQELICMLTIQRWLPAWTIALSDG